MLKCPCLRGDIWREKDGECLLPLRGAGVGLPRRALAISEAVDDSSRLSRMPSFHATLISRDRAKRHAGALDAIAVATVSF